MASAIALGVLKGRRLRPHFICPRLVPGSLDGRGGASWSDRMDQTQDQVGVALLALPEFGATVLAEGLPRFWPPPIDPVRRRRDSTTGHRVGGSGREWCWLSRACVRSGWRGQVPSVRIRRPILVSTHA